MSSKMSIKRKYARTRKSLSRGLALVALGYLIATFITQGAGSADEVSSVIAGISLLLTSLGLVRFGAEAPARQPSRKAPAKRAGHAPTLSAPMSAEGDSGRAIMPLGWLIIDGCNEIPVMTGFQAIKDLCACVPDGLPLTLFAMPTGNPHHPGWVTPGRLVVICGIGMVRPTV
jgi:hypothetical protein